MIYLIILFVILGGIITSDFSSKITRNRQYRFLFVLFVLVVGLRYRVGIDSMRFSDEYLDFPCFQNLSVEDFFSYYEPGWVLLGALFKTVSTNFVFIQLFSAIIFYSAIIPYFFKNSPYPYLCLLLFFIPTFFQVSFEATREAVAVALFLKYRNIFQKGFKYCLIVTLMCCMFHYGAIVLIFIYILEKNKFSTFQLICFVTLFILLFQYFLPALLTIGDGTDILQYKYRTYINRTASFNLYTCIKWICFSILLLLYLINRRAINLYKYRIAFYCYFAIEIVSFFTIPIISRFSNYFVFDYIIATSYIFKWYKERNKVFVASFIILVNLMPGIAWLNIKVTNTQSPNYLRYYPYSSILLEEKSREREEMLRVEY